MKKLACQYALLRFKPYVETGEFANVGVVLAVPEAGIFKYKLQHKYARITQFFHGLNGDVFVEARRQFEQELERFAVYYRDQANKANARLFAEFVHPRESLLQFDDVRVVLTDDPTLKLEELFGHYCNHDFATKEYVEKLMEVSVKTLLRDNDLGKVYRADKVGNEDLYFNFPFVRMNSDGGADRIIKPLNLDRGDTTKIISHGGQWVDRMRRLRKRNLLPKDVLVPVKQPFVGSKQYQAFEEIKHELGELNIAVVPVEDKGKILEFAT